MGRPAKPADLKHVAKNVSLSPAMWAALKMAGKRGQNRSELIEEILSKALKLQLKKIEESTNNC